MLLQDFLKEMSKWANSRFENEVHTVPLNDLVEHTYLDCVCGPTVVPVEREDGGINWQVIHEALDGRE